MIRPFWAEFHKALKSILNTDLPLQFSTLFLGNVDFQARRPDEYLFGILISAGKKNRSQGVGYFLNPHNTGVDRYSK